MTPSFISFEQKTSVLRHHWLTWLTVDGAYLTHGSYKYACNKQHLMGN